MPANERLRRLRTERNWSQQDVADQVGVALITMHRWERGSQHPSAYYRVKLCALFGVSAQELGFLEALPLSAPEEAEASTSAPSDATPFEEPALWTVPYARNPHFTGREELLSHLERRFARSAAEPPTTIHRAALTQVQAIKGLGGIGKTQTAIEYAYRAREQGRYRHTLWISTASEEAVMASFAALQDWVPALGEQKESDQRVLANRALRWLEQCQQPWLLIYDNADETAFLPPYLPIQGQGSILFTTRASAVGALAPSLEVDALSPEEGIQLLLRRAGRTGEVTEQEREKAAAIVLALGRFPLAIDQAGAYLEETRCGLADYLKVYQQHRYELLARRGKQATGYPDSVATTWSLAFEQIEQTDPAAAELLRLCAFVAPDQIPEELLIEGAPYWPTALQEAVRDRFRFNQMLSTLLAFSLIKRVGDQQMLSLHRLVQAVQQARMTPEEEGQWVEQFVFAVQAVFPHETDEGAYWPRCERLLQQAVACCTLIEQYQVQLAEAADLLNRTGRYLDERGLYRQAEPLLRRALSIREQILSPDHLDVATSLHDLGSLCWHQGNYTEGESLYRRVLFIREQQLGPGHPDVAEALNDLAILCWEQGDDAQAESLYLGALRIREEHLGPEHPKVADVLNNLGYLYHTQGKYEQAEPLHRRALRIWEQYLGSEHPVVAVSLNNLGLLYHTQGKYEQAEPLHRRALHIREQHLGSEHPDVAQSLNNLGYLYTHQGKYEQAEPLLQRALRIWEERLGAEHTHVASSLNNLAALYTRQGKYEQAEPLLQRALHIREQHLGSGHLETAKVLHYFAGLQEARGRTREAAIMYQRALITREHVLGPEHQLTLNTRARLQEVLVALEQAQETAPTEA